MARSYLDNAASTPIDGAAARVAEEVGSVAANAASVHSAGVWATREVERARMRLADAIGGSPEAITFTSGATQANNLALKGVVWGRSGARPHLVIRGRGGVSGCCGLRVS